MDSRQTFDALSHEDDIAILAEINSIIQAKSTISPLYTRFLDNPDTINKRMTSLDDDPPVLYLLASFDEGRELLKKHYTIISSASAETLNYISSDGVSLLLLLFGCFDKKIFSDPAVRAKISEKAFNARNTFLQSPASLLIDPPRTEAEYQFNFRCYYPESIDLFLEYPEFANLLSPRTLAMVAYRQQLSSTPHTLLWHFINDHANGLQVITASETLRKKITAQALDRETARLLIDRQDGQEFLLKFPDIQALVARHVSLAPSAVMSQSGRYHCNFVASRSGREFIAAAHAFRAKLSSNQLKMNLQAFGTQSLAYFLLTTHEGLLILHRDEILRNKIDSGILNMEFKSLGRSYTSFFADPVARDKEKTCDSILLRMLTNPSGIAFLEAHPRMCRLITKAGLTTTMEEGPLKGMSALKLLQEPELINISRIIARYFYEDKLTMPDLTNFCDWSGSFRTLGRRNP